MYTYCLKYIRIYILYNKLLHRHSRQTFRITASCVYIVSISHRERVSLKTRDSIETCSNERVMSAPLFSSSSFSFCYIHMYIYISVCVCTCVFYVLFNSLFLFTAWSFSPFLQKRNSRARTWQIFKFFYFPSSEMTFIYICTSSR